jgi:hypothetical protein
MDEYPTARALPRAPDWGASTPSGGHIVVVAGRITAAAGVALAAVIGWAIGGAWAGTALAGAALGFTLVAVAVQRARILAATGARPLAAQDAPRVSNLVDGLARAAGRRPRVFVFEQPDPNAFVWGGRRPIVALSRGAVSDFTRTEIEAVVAHCVVRLAFGTTRALPIATIASRIGGLRGPLVGVADDVAAAAVTRYPPALRTALAKCSPARGPYAPAFFAAASWSHVPTGERIAALEDL